MNNPMLEKALKRGVTLIEKQITDYEDRIEKVYLGNEDEPLALAFKVKVTGAGEKLKVETEIAFTESKVKDTAVELVTMSSLFDDDQQ